MTTKREVRLNFPWFTEAETESVVAALKSGWVTGGQATRDLEREFSEFCGRHRAIACSSGTAALWLALKALGLGPGDRVLSSAYTCDAITNACMLLNGLPPLVVDAEADTWGIDAHLVARALDAHPEIRAIVPAHIYGVPSRDTEAVVELCAARGVACIEDASEAHGAQIGRRRVGSFGDVSVFSFRGEKVLSGGQLGMVLTNDDTTADLVHQLSHCGLPVDSLRYWATMPAFNFQSSNLNAALALAQLRRIDDLLAARETVYRGWRDRFEKAPGVTFQGEYGRPVWWMVGLLYSDEFTPLMPQDLAAGLLYHGVHTRPGFYPIHYFPHGEGTIAAGTRCEVADRLLRRFIILPSGPTLTSEEQDYVIEAIQKVTGRRW